MPKSEAKAEFTVSNPDLLTETGDGQFRQMVHDLLAFSARLERVRSKFAASIGLTGIQYTILITIRQYQEGKGVGVKAVADHLALSMPFVTTETAKLVKLDLIDKTVHPGDQRRVNLRVTERGQSLLRGLLPVQREVNDALFEPIVGFGFDPFCALAHDLRVSAERAGLLADYLIDDNRGDS